MKNKKSLGQHWLKNRFILDDIADIAAFSAPENALCLEIGPGLGTLTSSLLRRFTEVVAIEYDKRLAENLPKSFPGKKLQVINADVLDLDIGALGAYQTQKTLAQKRQSSGRRGQEVVGAGDESQNAKGLSAPYVVVGNIPYYITSPILRLVLGADPKPARVVLLVQKEVAERAGAGAGRSSVLSLFVQNLAEVELGPVVRAQEFVPPPKVDSQVLILEPRREALVSEKVLDFAHRGFSNPRKKLASNLNGISNHTKPQWQRRLDECGLNPDARPQDLSLEDWKKLFIGQET